MTCFQTIVHREACHKTVQKVTKALFDLLDASEAANLTDL